MSETKQINYTETIEKGTAIVAGFYIAAALLTALFAKEAVFPLMLLVAALVMLIALDKEVIKPELRKAEVAEKK